MLALMRSFQCSYKRWSMLHKVELKEDDLDPTEYDMKAINNRFFKALHKTNRTIAEVAEVFGLDPNLPVVLQPKEKVPRPTMATMVKAAHFLGVSINWLLHGEITNDVDHFVESATSQQVHAFTATGSAIVQGNEQSTIIVNNDSLNDQERELVKMFRYMAVKNQVELLSHAYELAGGR